MNSDGLVWLVRLYQPICIGVPLGFLTAVYLAKLAPKRIKVIMKCAIRLIAGIPSVVYGLVGKSRLMN